MTSYTVRVKEFRDALLAEGVTPEIIDRLLVLANRQQVLATIDCNENIGDKFEQESRELHEALRACLGGPIKSFRQDNDPRGFTVKLFLKSGISNSWAGKEGGYGVPTRDFTADDIRRAAMMPARHWS